MKYDFKYEIVALSEPAEKTDVSVSGNLAQSIT